MMGIKEFEILHSFADENGELKYFIVLVDNGRCYFVSNLETKTVGDKEALSFDNTVIELKSGGNIRKYDWENPKESDFYTRPSSDSDNDAIFSVMERLYELAN